MSVVLPSSIDYTQSLPSLPDGVRTTSVVANPVNLQTSSPSSVIQFDLINNGFLNPQSMYLAYSYTATTAVSAELKGTPAYTAFSRLDEIIGSTSINTVQPYNMVCNDLVNLSLDVAQKYGMQPSYGYLGTTGIPSLETLDGRTLILNETGSFSAPLLGSVIANSEKLLPLFAMPQVSIRLTQESIANMFTTTVVPTGFVLSNIELRYEVIDMGSAIENLVRMMGQKIYIKTQGISATSQSLASGSAGSQTLIYNQRYNSIRALFAHFGGTTSHNTFFDSLATNNSSDYQFSVASISYPQRVLSSTTNKHGIQQELRKAVGSIADKSNSMSINSLEFAHSSASTTTLVSPGKFIVGTSTRVLDSDFLLTGISSQNSPISLLINTTATSQTLNVFLLIAYDAIFEIDLVNRQVSLKI